MRKTPLIIGEYYHIYNRGTDKRSTFPDKDCLNRFLQCMDEFNVVEPIGSIYLNSFNQLRGSTSQSEKLVEFVAYCLNPNHYHFLMTPLVEKGIEKFMQRLGTGYTMYFNEKKKRSGSLFQGRFKAEHINSNEYLLHVSVYVNLNDRVHKLPQLRGSTSQLSRSSWSQYMSDTVNGNREVSCNKKIILGQFKNKREYQRFAESSLKDILRRKKDFKDAEKFFLK